MPDPRDHVQGRRLRPGLFGPGGLTAFKTARHGPGVAKTEPQPGDRVRMTLPDGTAFEGLLMPRHAFSGPDILTLKLSSGYNVGLRAEGAKVEVLEAAKPRQTPSATLRDDASDRKST